MALSAILPEVDAGVGADGGRRDEGGWSQGLGWRRIWRRGR